MEGGSNQSAEGILGFYNSFLSLFPIEVQNSIGIFLLVFAIFFYALIVWHGYRFISKKNLLNLNLNKYNTLKHPFFTKFIASLFYFLEYLIISPIVIFISFTIFTLLLIFLNEGLEIGGILLVSAAIIGAIRVASYHKEDVSRELAKFLPLTLLTISLLNPLSIFSFEKVLNQLNEIPDFLSQITSYLLFIIGLEIILRLFDFIFSLLGLEEVEEIEEK
jgi:hypothetical protein